MEVSGNVFRPLPSFIGAGIEAHSNSRSKPSLFVVSFDVQILGSKRRIAKLRSSSGFFDKGHMQYYSEPTRGIIRCGSGKIYQAIKAKDKSMSKEENKMLMKKNKNKKRNRLELVKGLSRDLSMLSDLDLGLDNHGLVDPVRGKMVSEATELLLGQLQQLKTEEEETERKRKQEKAKMKAAVRMQKRLECELSSSSSSSSESSDSECDEVVNMSSLKSQAALAPPVINELVPLIMQEATALQLQNTLTQEEENALELPQPVSREAHATVTIPSTMNQKGASANKGDFIIGTYLPCSEQPCFTTQTSTSTNCNIVGMMAGGGGASSSVKKVEVCMGGKCKKSGAAALLDEFQRVLGAEGGSVVECKCMGKCKDGPNVRILNHSGDGVEAKFVDDSVMMPTSSPLCIGVGFGDVGSIVAKYLRDKHKELGLPAAS